jgi:uncharacterized membrane protein YedE/YeeE
MLVTFAIAIVAASSTISSTIIGTIIMMIIGISSKVLLTLPSSFLDGKIPLLSVDSYKSTRR